MYNGYDFYIDGLKLPMAPPSLEISVGSKNETVDLINGGEINILRSPSLIEVTFEARFPMRDYPYAPNVKGFEVYYDRFKTLKEKKLPFRFVVAREKPNGEITWDTNLYMALESFTLKEDWEEGDDVLIELNLKQFKPYGTKVVTITKTEDDKEQITPPPEEPRTDKEVDQTNYVVKSGDTLWGISKMHFGTGTRWKEIYDANSTVIEDTAKKYGKNSSSNGHWIWPGEELVLPSNE